MSRFVTWLFDCLFIDENSTNLGFFKQCINILNNDGIICIFPEGVINPRRYGFMDFRPSFVMLARKTNAKILPLYIYPEISFFKKSRIYVGNTLTINDYKQFADKDEACMFIQGKIMEYSFIIDKIVDRAPPSLPPLN